MNGNRVEELIRGETHHGSDEAEQNNSTTQKIENRSVKTVQPSANETIQEKMSSGMGVGILVFLVILTAIIIVAVGFLNKKRKAKEYERSLKLIPMLIHLPPSTDDIQGGGRDERDVNDEAISQATIMYTIISSTLKKELRLMCMARSIFLLRLWQLMVLSNIMRWCRPF